MRILLKTAFQAFQCSNYTTPNNKKQCILFIIYLCSQSGKRFFSNDPLSKEMATKQRLAITIPLAKKMGKEPAFYFA